MEVLVPIGIGILGFLLLCTFRSFQLEGRLEDAENTLCHTQNLPDESDIAFGNYNYKYKAFEFRNDKWRRKS